MSVYNGADIVASAVESILAQTYEDFELLLVDDGSDDDTEAVLRSFDDPRICVLVNESNRGLAGSLNRALDAARGEFVARMDADDRSARNRLDRQVAALDDDPDAVVATCWYDVIDSDGETVVTVREFERDRSFDADGPIAEGPGFTHGSVLVRTDALDAVGRYRSEFTYAQDLDLWLRMAERYGGEFVRVLPQTLHEYRVTPDQLRKRPIQQLYGDYARTCSKCRRRGDPLPPAPTASDHPARLSERRARGEYHRTIGTYLLKQNQRSAAVSSFARSLRCAPLLADSWVYLAMAFVPSSLRRAVVAQGKRLVRSARSNGT